MAATTADNTTAEKPKAEADREIPAALIAFLISAAALATIAAALSGGLLYRGEWPVIRAGLAAAFGGSIADNLSELIIIGIVLLLHIAIVGGVPLLLARTWLRLRSGGSAAATSTARFARLTLYAGILTTAVVTSDQAALPAWCQTRVDNLLIGLLAFAVIAVRVAAAIHARRDQVSVVQYRSRAPVARILTWAGLLLVLAVIRLAHITVADLFALTTIALPVSLAIYLRLSARVSGCFGPSFHLQIADASMRAICRDAAMAIIFMLGALILVMVLSAVPSIKVFGARFLITSDWRPVSLPGGPKLDANGDAVRDPDTGETVMKPDIPPSFGALPVIYGTAASSAIALFFAVPLSFGAAMFLVRVAPEIKPAAFLASVLGMVITAGVIRLATVTAHPNSVVICFILGAGILASGLAAMRLSFMTLTPMTTQQLETAFVGAIAIGSFLAALTLWSVGWAILIAPIAGLSAWSIGRNLPASISFLIEFLAAIPSIAYGIWGLFVLAPFLRDHFEPLFLHAWQNLPETTWPQFLLILLLPAACLFAGWTTLRLMDRVTMRRDAAVNPWAVRGVVAGSVLLAIASAGAATAMAFHGVRFMSGLNDILSTRLGGVPSLAWMFNYTGDDAVVHPVALTGNDLFCGGLILAIMIVPIITAVSRDILSAVPRAQIEGTSALGATWWQSSRAMLGYSRSGLFGAVMLGLARAAGETMAVTMVIGNNPQIRLSPFMAAQTMSSLLASQFREADPGVFISALFEVALILLIMSLLFNIIARYLVVGKQSRTAAAH